MQYEQRRLLHYERTIDQRQRQSNAAAVLPFRFLTDKEFWAVNAETNLIPLLTSESVAQRC